jgi:hypothetical protein
MFCLAICLLLLEACNGTRYKSEYIETGYLEKWNHMLCSERCPPFGLALLFGCKYVCVKPAATTTQLIPTTQTTTDDNGMTTTIEIINQKLQYAAGLCRVVSHRMSYGRLTLESGRIIEGYHFDVEGVAIDSTGALDPAGRVYIVHTVDEYFAPSMEKAKEHAEKLFPTGSMQHCLPEFRGKEDEE